jgi:hypothetical protein
MMRHKLGLSGRDLWEPPLQDGSDLSMQLPTPTVQQCAVGGILHQCVLEGVFRIRGRAVLEDQFSAHELHQGVIHFMLWHLRNSADELV